MLLIYKVSQLNEEWRENVDTEMINGIDSNPYNSYKLFPELKC